MAKYIMVVPSAPTEGKEAEYNKWYDEIHVPEVCAIPGITGAIRYKIDPAGGPSNAQPYLAIYSVETDDPSAVIAELQRRAGSGEIRMSDAIDVTTAGITLFKQR